MNAYTLGKRLQVFLKEVLPSHIHYHTEFEGHERISIISSQVDEYIDALDVNFATLDDDDDGKHDGNYSDDYHHVENGRHTLATSEREAVEFKNEAQLSTKSDDGNNEEEIDAKIEAVVEAEDCTTYCGSSTSTSYSVVCKVDWDDCECTESGGGGNGFILTQPKMDADTGGINKVAKVASEIPDFQFKTLISHWKAQEKKWNEQRSPNH